MNLCILYLPTYNCQVEELLVQNKEDVTFLDHFISCAVRLTNSTTTLKSSTEARQIVFAAKIDVCSAHI